MGQVTAYGINYYYHGDGIPRWAWPTREQIREDLKEGLSCLREKGWNQGSMIGSEGSVCAIGALQIPIAQKWGQLALSWSHDPTLAARYFAARALLDLKVREMTANGVDKIEQFNDLFSTKREDVESLYEKVIADL